MSYLAKVLPYATLLAVLVAIVFGLLDHRHMRRTRRLTAAAELVQTLKTAAFVHSMQLILELPEDADPQLVLANPEMVSAAYVVGHAFESLGVLVFHRLLPLHLVDHLLGGYARQCWRRLEPYMRVRRASLGPTFGEWFQWLVERMAEWPVPGKHLGAHEMYRAWRP